MAARLPVRWPLVLTILASLAVLGPVAYMVVGNVTGPLPYRMVDLSVYRTGGLSVLHGAQLYGVRAIHGLLFTYPPISAILAVPLALVPWQAAVLLWLAMIYVPLAIVTWISFRPLLARIGTWKPALFAVLLGAGAYLLPLRQELHYGQIDIFLVALCVLDCAVKRPRWPRGVLIGLATAIKLEPGVFIIYLFITGRRKAAAVAALTFAGVSGLAWAIAPGDSSMYWTSAIFSSSRLGQNGQAANQALRGMVMRAFAPSPAPTAVWLGIALVVAVAGFAAAYAVRRRGHELGGVAITGMLAAMLSPVGWIHHLCWIVVALGVIVGDGRNWRRVLTAVLAGALFASTLPIWGKRLWVAHAVPNLVGRFLEATFGLAALAVIAIIFWLRRSPPDPAAELAAAESSSAGPQGKVLTSSRE